MLMLAKGGALDHSLADRPLQGLLKVAGSCLCSGEPSPTRGPYHSRSDSILLCQARNSSVCNGDMCHSATDGNTLQSCTHRRYHHACFPSRTFGGHNRLSTGCSTLTQFHCDGEALLHTAGLFCVISAGLDYSMHSGTTGRLFPHQWTRTTGTELPQGQ